MLLGDKEKEAAKKAKKAAEKEAKYFANPPKLTDNNKKCAEGGCVGCKEKKSIRDKFNKEKTAYLAREGLPAENADE